MQSIAKIIGRKILGLYLESEHLKDSGTVILKTFVEQSNLSYVYYFTAVFY